MKLMRFGYREANAMRQLAPPYSLRNRAKARFALRVAEIDENPLRRCARGALIGIRIAGLAFGKHRSPAPVRSYSRFAGGKSETSRLLHGIERKVAGGTDNHDRETRCQIYAHS